MLGQDFTNLQFEYECDPEIDFCDSEIPLNDVNQQYSVEALKVLAYVGFAQLTLVWTISSGLVENYRSSNDIETYIETFDS